MNISADFIKKVFGALRARLAALGFEERKPGILTIQMAADVLGWIGLNKAIHGQKGVLEINAVVGVRNQRIEKLVAELLGETFDELIPATLAGNIGYMTPQNKYRPYNFPANGPPEMVAEELFADVREFGLQFIRNHTEMAALVEGLRTCRFAIRFVADYRIPAGLLLLDRIAEAEAYLKTKLLVIENQRDPAALRYKGFAAKFGEHVGHKTSVND